jgi:hypothetical protein
MFWLSPGTVRGFAVSKQAMIRLRTVRRIAGRSALVLLVLFLGLLATVQAQQWLLRWRAERLMADMHRIRLYQTTWPEAQELMRKWGAWGRWNGSCTFQQCEYAIDLGDGLFWGNGTDEGPGWLNRAYLRVRACGILGLRIGSLRATFTVHVGTIWRTSERIGVEVPPDWFSKDPLSSEYGLLITVKSREQLNRNNRGDRILGAMEQLAEHPYFVSGSPSGCETCLAGDVTYSTRTPQWQIDELTTFNFACFTQWRPCRFLDELYPVADRWQSMGWMFDFGHPRNLPTPSASECDIPLWALGRDFNSVTKVEALSIQTVKDERYSEPSQFVDKVNVRILSTLKGRQQPEGQTVDVYPFPGEDLDFHEEMAEHLRPGRRYLLLWQDAPNDPPLADPSLPRCGVQPDTPEVRAELAKGFAMNDDYRDHSFY